MILKLFGSGTLSQPYGWTDEPVLVFYFFAGVNNCNHSSMSQCKTTLTVLVARNTKWVPRDSKEGAGMASSNGSLVPSFIQHLEAACIAWLAVSSSSPSGSSLTSTHSVSLCPFVRNKVPSDEPRVITSSRALPEPCL